MANLLKGMIVRVFAACSVFWAGALAAETLDGFWIDSHGEVILEVGPCGKSRCGKVAWLRLPNGPDGKPLRDYKNPEARLRSRPVCGLTVVSGFRKKGGRWEDGTVYAPDYGMSFSGYAEVLSASKVRITGYMFVSVFSQSETWTRVTKPFEDCRKPAEPLAAEKADAPPPAPKLLREGKARTAKTRD